MTFDSQEEEWMYWWFKELESAGYVKLVEMHPFSYPLFDGVSVKYFEPYKKKEGGKYTDEPIIPEHVYTPDMIVWWDDSALGLFAEPFNSDNRKKKGRVIDKILCQKHDEEAAWYSVIEVKPNFDRFNMIRIAKIHIQWVFQKFSDYINIVSPKTHFPKSFTPQKYMITKTGKARKLPYKKVLTLDEFINSQN